MRLLFLFLFIAAAVSFVLCVVSDVRMSVTHEQTTGEVGWALTWLVGHSFHGGIVVLLPVAYLLLQPREVEGRVEGASRQNW
jgi:hypothetical protein